MARESDEGGRVGGMGERLLAERRRSGDREKGRGGRGRRAVTTSKPPGVHIGWMG